MDNHIADMTDDELKNLHSLWREVFKSPQNRAIFESTPGASQFLHALLDERRKRNPAPVYRHPRGVSGYGSRQALHRACGDSTFAHYYDTRKW